jgi:hypothetical protein
MDELTGNTKSYFLQRWDLLLRYHKGAAITDNPTPVGSLSGACIRSNQYLMSRVADYEGEDNQLGSARKTTVLNFLLIIQLKSINPISTP